MGLIVSDLLRKKESMQHLKDALPSWCNPEQAQQLGMLKVKTSCANGSIDFMPMLFICQFRTQHTVHAYVLAL